MLLFFVFFLLFPSRNLSIFQFSPVLKEMPNANGDLEMELASSKEMTGSENEPITNMDERGSKASPSRAIIHSVFETRQHSPSVQVISVAFCKSSAGVFSHQHQNNSQVRKSICLSNNTKTLLRKHSIRRGLQYSKYLLPFSRVILLLIRCTKEE